MENRVQIILTDHKIGRTVPVKKIECNDRTGVVIGAWGYDYKDPDSDYQGTVSIGGYLDKKFATKEDRTQRLRYELQYKLLAPGQDATIHYYDELEVSDNDKGNAN